MTILHYILSYTLLLPMAGGLGGVGGGVVFNHHKRYLVGFRVSTGNRNDYTTFIIFIDTFVTLISERVYMR